ncbi:MAG: CBS domain-containing protein [Pseudomonadota bacterium]
MLSIGARGRASGPDPLQRKTAPLEDPAALTVADVMTTHVSAAWQDSTVKELAVIMAGEAIGSIPVVDPDNRLLGLVTYRDIVIRACAGDRGIDDLRACDAMTPQPTGIGPSATISHALAEMGRLHVHRLPVVDGGAHLIGMVSLGDIATRGGNGTGPELLDTIARIADRKSFWNRV